MKVILILTLSLAPIFGFSQAQLSTKSKKAAEYYYQADNYRVRGQYAMAIQLLEKAIDKDSKFHEAYFRLGTIYKASGELNKAEELLLRSDELSDGQSAGSKFELGELYLKKGEYENAIRYIDDFLAMNSRNQGLLAEAKKMKADAQYSLKNIDKNSKLNPQPLNDSVNSFPMQYFPVLTVDQKSIIYTRRLGTTMAYDEDLVISTKNSSGEWGSPVSLSDNINTEWNEGTRTISADGRTLIFTSCSGRDGYGSCDLYISYKEGAEWSVPKNLGPKINSNAWESQPSLSSDGRTLYFISNRRGGVGGRDIWRSARNDKGEWSTPVNLGKNVNTHREEVSPFIHPNNKTLYFASNGLTGFGGFDIFYSQRDGDSWKEPSNLGYPVNNSQDQVSLFITADGEKGYYSHEIPNDPNKKGVIYEVDMPENAKVKYRSSYVYGVIHDASTDAPLKATIELFNLDNDQRESMITSDSVTGEYLMVLTEGSEYALYVNKKGYLFESASFNFEMEDEPEPVHQDITLHPIAEGAKAVLHNIFFDLDSYTLKEKSKTELQKLKKFLNNNPEIKIEIGGHTDNTGNADYNLNLSRKRARAVYDFLKKNGVADSQLTYKGYGQTKPAVPNDSEENRRMNRRIEFRIVNK